MLENTNARLADAPLDSLVHGHATGIADEDILIGEGSPTQIDSRAKLAHDASVAFSRHSCDVCHKSILQQSGWLTQALFSTIFIRPISGHFSTIRSWTLGVGACRDRLRLALGLSAEFAQFHRVRIFSAHEACILAKRYAIVKSMHTINDGGPSKFTDSELLDWLDEQNGLRRYTGRCLFRLSTSGRGWRLCETSEIGASRSARGAIAAAMLRARAAQPKE